jgi:hypothetical protein
MGVSLVPGCPWLLGLCLRVSCLYPQVVGVVENDGFGGDDVLFAGVLVFVGEQAFVDEFEDSVDVRGDVRGLYPIQVRLG